MNHPRHKIHLLVLMVAFFVLLAISYAAWGARNIRGAAQNKWEPAIKEFEKWDAKNSFPKNCVLFVGSSSIRWWNTAVLFPEFPVINRGFGGAQISDINYYVKRIVIPYRPKVIIFYCGGNDLYSAKKSPEQVFSDYQRFVSTVQASLPKTRIVFMSIKPGPSGWSQRHLPDKVNSMIKTLSAKKRNLFYADVVTGMLNSKGVPDPKDYQNDGVHLTYRSDKKWAALLKPTLRKVYNLK